MEQNRKHLKISSVIVLVLAAVTFLRVAGEFLFGDWGTTTLPDGLSESLVLAARIVLAVITFALLAPQIYMGIKGLRIAKNPVSTKGHIVWAAILFVLAILSLIDPATALVQNINLLDNAVALISGVLSSASYFYYLWFANAVAKEN